MPESPGKLVFLGRAQRELMTRGAPVFTYHKIGVPPHKSRDPFLYARPDTFDHQLTSLRETGAQAVRLGDLVKPDDNRAQKFVVTFDDGFRNVMELGLPVLSRHRIPAIQFIVADYIGKQNDWDIAKGDCAEPLMNRTQIKEWIAAGHEIGSHSRTHRNLKRSSPAEAREEIFASKKMLEDIFGTEIRHFCYPFGGWTPAARDLVKEAGYQTACTVEFGVNDAAADPFALRRIIPLSCPDVGRKMFHRLKQKMGLVR